MEQEARRNYAPYIPFKTFQTALDVLAQGLPNQIDRSMWPSFAGGTQSQILSAFRFLGLIDEKGNTQPTLRTLVQEEERRSTNLAAILETQYPKVMALARESASPKQFVDAMAEVSSQATLRKAIAFFLPAATFAGVPIPKLWQTRRKRGTGSPRKVAKQNQEPKSGEPKPRTPKPSHQDGTTKTIKLRSGGSITLSITVDLMGMSVEDRKWVFEVIDKFAGYEHQHGPSRPDEVAVGDN